MSTSTATQNVAGTQVLKADSISVGYVGQPVVRDVSFQVESGQVVCLLGPNGAGKTTTLMGLTGVLPVMSGSVEMFGEVTVAGLHKRARAGLSYVTEERSVIKSVSLRDNIRLAGIEPPSMVRQKPAGQGAQVIAGVDERLVERFETPFELLPDAAIACPESVCRSQ